MSALAARLDNLRCGCTAHPRGVPFACAVSQLRAVLDEDDPEHAEERWLGRVRFVPATLMDDLARST